jgi:4-hydroxy-tetrahydrodipicolinate reductase
MAYSAAQSCLRKGLTLAPFALTGPAVTDEYCVVTDEETGRSQKVKLCPAGSGKVKDEMSSFKDDKLLAIDYTHPTAVLNNAEFYVANNIPFVMGSTGGDRDALLKTVSAHPCVIAPNMGKQIVAVQLALENLAKDYPGSFDGYKLSVTESHQKTKADTSGTCLAVVKELKKLQGPNSPEFKDDDIVLLRDDASSEAFGVPPEYINKGHAHHTYKLTSPDGTTQFELQHDVNGRRIYADGTADAVVFLGKILDQGGDRRVYNMIDVLKGGAMN